MQCPPFPDISSFLSLSVHFLCTSSISLSTAFSSHQPDLIHLPPPLHPPVPVSPVWRRAPCNETCSYHFLITTALATLSRVTTAITNAKHQHTGREDCNKSNIIRHMLMQLEEILAQWSFSAEKCCDCDN